MHFPFVPHGGGLLGTVVTTGGMHGGELFQTVLNFQFPAGLLRLLVVPVSGGLGAIFTNE